MTIQITNLAEALPFSDFEKKNIAFLWSILSEEVKKREFVNNFQACSRT